MAETKELYQQEVYVNRQYKDRLFKFVFKEKEDLLQLYNAINGTDYNNPEDIEVNTLEDVIYMGMKNDISFLLTDVLNLYEHQSTFSPNLPLRGLFYFSRLYQKTVRNQTDLYSSKIIHFEKNCDEDGFLSASALSGRDDMQICVFGNDERIILVSRFDNLGKGASGAAIQNMNIVLVAEETKGLIL